MLHKKFKLSFFVLLCAITQSLFSVPNVTNVSPNIADTGIATAVTITGSGFTGATAVAFGQYTGTILSVDSDTQLTALSPIPTVPGVVDIIVTGPSGSSFATRGDLFTFHGHLTGYMTSNVDDVTAFNATTNNAITTLNTGGVRATTMAITPDGKTAYVVNRFSFTNQITIIDVATNTISGQINIPFPTMNDLELQDIAIDPDGVFAYVTASSAAAPFSGLIRIDLDTNATLPIPISADALEGIAITPSGDFAYVVSNDVITPSVIPVDLDTQTPGAPIFLPDLASNIAIVPEGTTAYVPLTSGPEFVIPIDLATNTAGTPIPVPLDCRFVAIAPSGGPAYISGAGDIVPINTATNTVEPTISFSGATQLVISPNSLLAYICNALTSSVDVFEINSETIVGTIPTPSGFAPRRVGLTPDQAPLAVFTSTAGPVDSPTTFDASLSNSPVGEIATYQWDFGDGETVITETPVVEHTYTEEGAFIVTLIVTNTNGTSIFQTFTGQTVSNNGGITARVSQAVEIEPGSVLPPSNFRGLLLKNRFLNETEFLLKSHFEPSPSPDVIEYNIYKGGKIVAVIPANGPFRYRACLGSEQEAKKYSVAAVGPNGISSKVRLKIVKR